jgi:hypothetical protein
VAVLGASSGLRGQDAFDLDRRAAPRQAHFVRGSGQRGDAFVGQCREGGKLVGGQQPMFVEQRRLGSANEGAGHAVS